MITWYKVDLDKKISFRFFSDMYKGIWHDHIVARVVHGYG